MQIKSLIPVMVIFIACVGISAQDKPDPEKSKLKGTWLMKEIRVDGKVIDQEEEIRKALNSKLQLTLAMSFLNIRINGNTLELISYSMVRQTNGILSYAGPSYNKKYDFTKSVFDKTTKGIELKATIEYLDDTLIITEFEKNTGKEYSKRVFKLDDKAKYMTETETGNVTQCTPVLNGDPKLAKKLKIDVDCREIKERAILFQRN